MRRAGVQRRRRVGDLAGAQAQANAFLAAGDPQSAALAMGMSSDDWAKLQGAVTSPGDLAQAVSGYVNLDTNAQAAVTQLADKNYLGALKNISKDLGIAGTSQLIDAGQSLLSGDLLGAIGPLVAGALAATGVGAPIVAAVGGAIALGEQALKMLGVGQGPQGCAWKLGKICFNGVRPYGPNDPQWRTLSSVAADHANDPLWPAEAVDHYYATAMSEVRWLEHGGPQFQTSPVANNRQLDGFRLAFLRSYLANLEKGANGHPMSDPVSLLNTAAMAWNRRWGQGAGSTTINADAAPHSMPAQNVPGTTFSPGRTVPNAGLYQETLLEMVMRGDLTGQRQPPLTIAQAGPSLYMPSAGFRLPQSATSAPQPPPPPAVHMAMPQSAPGAVNLGPFGAALSALQQTAQQPMPAGFVPTAKMPSGTVIPLAPPSSAPVMPPVPIVAPAPQPIGVPMGVPHAAVLAAAVPPPPSGSPGAPPGATNWTCTPKPDGAWQCRWV